MMLQCSRPLLEVWACFNVGAHVELGAHLKAPSAGLVSILISSKLRVVRGKPSVVCSVIFIFLLAFILFMRHRQRFAPDYYHGKVVWILASGMWYAYSCWQAGGAALERT